MTCEHLEQVDTLPYGGVTVCASGGWLRAAYSQDSCVFGHSVQLWVNSLAYTSQGSPPPLAMQTRLQAQAAQSASQHAQQNPAFRLATAELASCPPSCSTTTPVTHAANCGRFSSTVDGIQKIVRREGLRALWRGLDASLLMAVPAVCFQLLQVRHSHGQSMVLVEKSGMASGRLLIPELAMLSACRQHCGSCAS